MRKVISIFIAAVMSASCAAIEDSTMPRKAPNESSLLFVRGKVLEVGIHPMRGGRTVILRVLGSGENLLDQEPDTWGATPKSEQVLLDAPFLQDRGQVVWWGPQHRFWAEQTLHALHREKISTWPPDPFLTEAPYKVISHENRKLVLRSPVSKFSNIQITKTWEAQENGTICFSVEAVSPHVSIRSRNLWFNMRVSPNAREFVPVGKAAEFAISPLENAIPRIFSGILSIELPPGGASRDKVSLKVNVCPSEGWMAAGFPTGFLLLKFPLTSKENMVENHSPVEIFREWQYGKPFLLEMEQHGPSANVAAGEAIFHREVWEWIPFTGKSDVETQANFLSEVIRSRE